MVAYMTDVNLYYLFLLTLVSPLTKILVYHPNCLNSILYTNYFIYWHHILIQEGEKLAHFLLFGCCYNTMGKLRVLKHSPLCSIECIKNPNNNTLQVPRSDSAFSNYSIHSIKEVPSIFMLITVLQVHAAASMQFFYISLLRSSWQLGTQQEKQLVPKPEKLIL